MYPHSLWIGWRIKKWYYWGDKGLFLSRWGKIKWEQSRNVSSLPNIQATTHTLLLLVSWPLYSVLLYSVQIIYVPIYQRNKIWCSNNSAIQSINTAIQCHYLHNICTMHIIYCTVPATQFVTKYHTAPIYYQFWIASEYSFLYMFVLQGRHHSNILIAIAHFNNMIPLLVEKWPFIS